MTCAIFKRPDVVEFLWIFYFYLATIHAVLAKLQKQEAPAVDQEDDLPF